MNIFKNNKRLKEQQDLNKFFSLILLQKFAVVFFLFLFHILLAFIEFYLHIEST